MDNCSLLYSRMSRQIQQVRRGMTARHDRALAAAVISDSRNFQNPTSNLVDPRPGTPRAGACIFMQARATRTKLGEVLLLGERAHHAQHAARRRIQIALGVDRVNGLAVRAGQRDTLSGILDVRAIILLPAERLDRFSARLELDRISAVRSYIRIPADAATTGQKTGSRDGCHQNCAAKSVFHLTSPIQDFATPTLIPPPDGPRDAEPRAFIS